MSGKLTKNEDRAVRKALGMNSPMGAPFKKLKDVVKKDPSLLERAPLLSWVVHAGALGAKAKQGKLEWLLEQGADPSIPDPMFTDTAAAALAAETGIPLKKRVAMLKRMEELGDDLSSIPPGEVQETLGSKPAPDVLAGCLAQRFTMQAGTADPEARRPHEEAIQSLVKQVAAWDTPVPTSPHEPYLTLVHHAAVESAFCLERVLEAGAASDAPAAAKGSYAVIEAMEPGGGVLPSVTVEAGDTPLDLVCGVLGVLEAADAKLADRDDDRFRERRRARIDRLRSTRALLQERGGAAEAPAGREQVGPAVDLPFKGALDRQLLALARFSDQSAERLQELLDDQRFEPGAGPYTYLGRSLDTLRPHVRGEEIADKLKGHLFGRLLLGAEACFPDGSAMPELEHHPAETREALEGEAAAIIATRDADIWYVEKRGPETRVCRAHPEGVEEIAPSVEAFVEDAVASL